MMGLSLAKLAFTALVIFILWRALRWAGAVAERGARRNARKAERVGRSTALDLVACPQCGTYLPPGQRCAACERRP